MKLGYPAINLGLGCTSSHTFRLASLTADRLRDTVALNLACLRRTIEWNTAHDLRFFRITSNLIPFASHPAMQQIGIDWRDLVRDELRSLGDFVRRHDMRISQHPGQFVVLNSPSDTVYRNSVAELQYHADLLDMMGLDASHKLQIHVGGLYGDAESSGRIFAERHAQLPEAIRRRLVIENDERVASIQDCLRIHEATGIPVLFDTLHHAVNNRGETTLAGLKLAMATWGKDDGVPMIDYSDQNPDKKTGAHAISLDVVRFRSFVRSLRGRDIDIMFEIKNKEASGLQAKIVVDNLASTG
jgi:UV DNA damage endonuclease